jgi:hypothetical protein
MKEPARPEGHLLYRAKIRAAIWPHMRWRNRSKRRTRQFWRKATVRYIAQAARWMDGGEAPF